MKRGGEYDNTQEMSIKLYLVLYRAWFTLYCTGPGLPCIALECATRNPGFDMHCCIGAAKDV